MRHIAVLHWRGGEESRLSIEYDHTPPAQLERFRDAERAPGGPLVSPPLIRHVFRLRSPDPNDGRPHYDEVEAIPVDQVERDDD